MKDDAGRLVGEPLNYGCRFCRFHCEIFLRRPAAAALTEQDVMVFYLDFETSGLDVFRDFAEIARTELAVIDEQTTVRGFQQELRWNQAYYRLAQGL